MSDTTEVARLLRQMGQSDKEYRRPGVSTATVELRLPREFPGRELGGSHAKESR